MYKAVKIDKNYSLYEKLSFLQLKTPNFKKSIIKLVDFHLILGHAKNWETTKIYTTLKFDKIVNYP